MASLLQYSTLPLSNNHCSSSLPSLTCHLSKRSNRNTQKLLEKKKYHIKKSLICQSGIDELAFIELPGTKEAKAELIGSLKLKLLVLNNSNLLDPSISWFTLFCFNFPFSFSYIGFNGCILDCLSWFLVIILFFCGT